MDAPPSPSPQPPRLLVRTTIYTFVTVVTILVAVFVVLTLDLRARARREVAQSLEDARAVVAALDERRRAELQAEATALAGNPTFAAALQKHRNEMGSFSPFEVRSSVEWIERQAQRVAEILRADVVAVVDTGRVTVTRAGPAAPDWPRTLRPAASRAPGDTPVGEQVVHMGNDAFRVVSVPLVVRSAAVGSLVVADRLDARYAADVSTVTRAATVVVANGVTIASTLSSEASSELAAVGRALAAEGGHLELLGEAYGFRRLFAQDGTTIYALAPLRRAVSSSTAGAFLALGVVAVGSLLLAGLGSVLLARRIASPIETISQALAEAVASRQPHVQLPADGSSRELDGLVVTFNGLMAAVAASEAETERTYLGTIESLATALEARDPYTAGHSQRVCDLSVRIGRRMGLSPEALEVLRLGSLFHDIGKIGVDDAVLRKPGRLTLEEFQAIRQHPTLGARILGPIGLLPPLLAIVEHHHERFDGRGYPLGLAGDAIPLEARIVHVADAFDAMVSARPYRPARPVQDAMDELAACRGTNFDPDVVDTCLAVLREAGSPLTDENELPRAG